MLSSMITTRGVSHAALLVVPCKCTDDQMIAGGLLGQNICPFRKVLLTKGIYPISAEPGSAKTHAGGKF